MIKPTIGRVVWFWTCAGDAEKEGAQPNAALVTFVHSDECVNLAVFDREGDSKPYPAIQLWQGDGERPRSLHCEWMPYQKGQAAKVDAEMDSAALALRLSAVEQDLKVLLRGRIAGVPPPAQDASPKPKDLIAGSTFKPQSAQGEDPRKEGTGAA